MEIPHHVRERRAQCRSPSDQHVIATGAQPFAARRRQPDDFAQAAAYPVSLRGAAHLPRHGEADAGGALVGADARLDYERIARHARTVGHGPKIAPAFQPFNNDGRGVPLTH